MAKTKKKQAPVKSAPKKAAKSAPVKAAKSAKAVKPAGKAAPAKKMTAKAPARPAPKVAAKQKPIAKSPEKAAKKAAPSKETFKESDKEAGKDKKVLIKKAAVIVPQKADKKSSENEPEIKKSPAPIETAPKVSAKKDAKAAAKKAKAPKKEESEEEDDFVADDDFGPDEMSEYEEDLKAVEELDEEPTEDDTLFIETKDKGDEEVFLTDAEGRRYCRSRDCDQVGIVDGYCRYHYLLYWKKIQVRKKILLDGKLDRYVEELTARYPDKFLEMIRRDLRTEKDFLGAIQELEIDESAGENEFEEDTTAYVEEIRGMEGAGSGVEEEEF